MGRYSRLSCYAREADSKVRAQRTRDIMGQTGVEDMEDFLKLRDWRRWKQSVVTTMMQADCVRVW